MEDQKQASQFDGLEENSPEKRPLIRRLFRISGRLLFFCFGLLLALMLVLHIPVVQNWAAQKASAFLSDEFQTTVSLEYIRIGVFDSFILDEFYIEDLTGDTLLYSDRLQVGLKRGLFGLLFKKLYISEIGLENATIELERGMGSRTMNYQFIQDYFSRADPIHVDDTVYVEKKKPLDLDISSLRLKNVDFVRKDSVRGQDITAYVGSGLCNFRKIDLDKKQIDITHFTLTNPEIYVDQYVGDTILFDELFINPPPSLGPVYIKEDTTILTTRIARFRMVNGKFGFHNYWRAPERWTPPDIIDYNHMDLFDINMDIRNLQMTGLNFKGKVASMNFKDSTGFVCENISVEDGLVTDTLLVLNDLEIITPTSRIGDTLIMEYTQYTDFKDYVNQIYMIGYFHDAKVSVEDIMAFAPILEGNAFFQKNRDEVVAIDGMMRGTVNSLGGRDLEIRLNEDTYLKGGFGSFGLAMPGLVAINPELDQMSTSIQTLRDLIPGFNPPEIFDKLGRLDFRGRVDGFFSDLVIKGNLQTELGNVILDNVILNLTGQRETFGYKGGLSLIGFELDRWTDNPDLGTITVTSRVIDGRGVTGSSANAKLEAQIDSFFYKNYNYKDLTMDGQIEANRFTGFFQSEDPNIDFNFNGTIDFSKQVPFFDFEAKVNNLDMKRLNLLEKDLAFRGDIDLKMRDIRLNKMNGVITLSDLVITENRNFRHEIDTLQANAFFENGSHVIALESDILKARMEGRFFIEDMRNEILHYFERNFPTYADRFDLKPDAIPKDTSVFTYSVDIFDSKDLLQILHPDLEPIKDVKIVGKFDPFHDIAALDLELPNFQFGNISMEDIILIIEGDQQNGEIEFGVNHTQIGEGFSLQPALLFGDIYEDTLEVSLTVLDLLKNEDILGIDAKVFPDSQDFLIRFDQSEITLLNQVWQIEDNNLIRLGPDYLQTRGFVFTNDVRQVILESSGPKGLMLDFRNFNMSFIDSIWIYDKLEFEGPLNLNASIDDVFEMTDIKLEAHVPDFKINADDWGELDLNVEAQDFKSPFITDFVIEKPNQFLKLEGQYNPPNDEKSAPLKRSKFRPNYLDFTLSSKNFPLSILEYWLASGISDTEGLIAADVKIKGPPSKPEISGTATAESVATTIDYLNTRYFVDRHVVKLNNSLIDATNARVKDENNNYAKVTGGITHDHLSNFGLKVRIEADTFLVLNTSKGQNNLYYGTAIGKGDVRFSGNFAQPDIFVKASSGPGTKIFIPVDYEQEASEVRFIKWKKEEEEEEEEETAVAEPLGVSIEMELEIDQDAVVEIVFDEQTGDVLRGIGNGNLRLLVPRGEDFQMFGSYVVESGDYLFTLMNLFISKPFEVRQGGTIRWQGDPFNAQINIQAQYKDLKASLANFISEYLSSSEFVNNQDETGTGRLQADVDLLMKLTGNLLSPDINFDIEFPNLTGPLKNFTDSKLRLLRQDQNEMNRQVFGLIVVGDFIPSNFDIATSQLGFGINTVTEMLSQQLSLYLTELVSEWLVEDGLVSGIDFDIAYNYIEGYNLSNIDDPSAVVRANELQVRLKNYLFNDRLSVNVGGNFDLGGQNVSANPNAGVFFAGDLVIEYVLSQDRNLKIRFYQSTEPEINGSRRYQTGLGLSFRRQFDTFDEFLEGLKTTTRQMKREERKRRREEKKAGN